MKTIVKKSAAIFAAASFVALAACDDASVVSANLSTAADQFEIDRRVVFYNGITGDYMLVIEGLCSIEPIESRLEVVCKTGEDEYKKHFLGLSDNVTYFVEQVESAHADPFHYRVIFKPESVLPDFDLVTSVDE